MPAGRSYVPGPPCDIDMPRCHSHERTCGEQSRRERTNSSVLRSRTCRSGSRRAALSTRCPSGRRRRRQSASDAVSGPRSMMSSMALLGPARGICCLAPGNDTSHERTVRGERVGARRHVVDSEPAVRTRIGHHHEGRAGPPHSRSSVPYRPPRTTAAPWPATGAPDELKTIPDTRALRNGWS